VQKQGRQGPTTPCFAPYTIELGRLVYLLANARGANLSVMQLPLQKLQINSCSSLLITYKAIDYIRRLR
jgi:hypothetical protein